jgi:hypothetical protein
VALNGDARIGGRIWPWRPGKAGLGTMESNRERVLPTTTIGTGADRTKTTGRPPCDRTAASTRSGQLWGAGSLRQEVGEQGSWNSKSGFLYTNRGAVVEGNRMLIYAPFRNRVGEEEGKPRTLPRWRCLIPDLPLRYRYSCSLCKDNRDILTFLFSFHKRQNKNLIRFTYLLFFHGASQDCSKD